MKQRNDPNVWQVHFHVSSAVEFSPSPKSLSSFARTDQRFGKKIVKVLYFSHTLAFRSCLFVDSKSRTMFPHIPLS